MIVRNLLVALVMLTFFCAGASPARADWPSADEVLKTVMKAAGLDPDEIEAVKFAIKEPQCAATIVSYTVAQDYALVAFIGALKTTKISSIPGLPKMSAGSCNSYNPVQRAYAFIDSQGEKILGKAQADFFRTLLADQIAQGKSELDSQIAAIPYIGTVLSNWDCGCDAAFKTNFEMETMVNDKVGQIIAIGQDVKKKDYAAALEKLIKNLGPEIACELGAKWSGVDSVPIVSDFAAQACESVAGKAVGWVVSGAGAIAEGVGIVGYEHMHPDEFFKGKYEPVVGKPDWRDWKDLLYKQCYGYFEPSNMSETTAMKVCLALGQRFTDLNEGMEQSEQMEKDPAYGKDYIAQLVQNTLFLSDGEFDAKVKEADATCETYNAQKYPKAIFVKEYYKNKKPGAADLQYCSFDSYITSNRQKSQQSYTYGLAKTLQPFCQATTGKRNEIVCVTGKPLDTCKAQVPETCLKASGGGWQKPCCILGDGADPNLKENGKKAEKWAAQVGGKYCATSEKNPLAIVCALEQTYQACMKKTAKNCSAAKKFPDGTDADICCANDPAKLESVPGVKQTKTFVMTANISQKGICGIGGMQDSLSYDPLIVHCRSDYLEICKKTFPANCAKDAFGFAVSPCCELSAFQGKEAQERPYDPKTRDKADLKTAKDIVGNSGGSCRYGTTQEGKEDAFKIICNTESSLKQCVEQAGRDAKTPCNKKISNTGYVTSLCCERDMKSLENGLIDQKPLQDKAGAPKAGSLGAAGGLESENGNFKAKKGLAGQRKKTDTSTRSIGQEDAPEHSERGLPRDQEENLRNRQPSGADIKRPSATGGERSAPDEQPEKGTVRSLGSEIMPDMKEDEGGKP